jgi:hypothetical protein
MVFLCDGYCDLPPSDNKRAVLEHELRRLKMMSWADPGDAELREMVAQVEGELRALAARRPP